MSRTGTIPATTKEAIIFETPPAKKQFMQEESRVKGHLLAFWKTEDCEVQRG